MQVSLLNLLMSFLPPLLATNALAQNDRLEPGLTLRLYDIGRPMDRLAPLRADQTPNVDRRLDTLDLRSESDFGGPDNYFVAVALGYLQVETPGEYAFQLTSDDGSRLTINGGVVITHDGNHAATPKAGRVRLEAGLHPFRVDMFENEGDTALSLAWQPPGTTGFVTVPPEAFRIEAGVTRVVSPGRKIVLDGRETLRPGDGLPLEAVHPAWTLETIRPAGFEPMVGGMDFLPDGRLVIANFVPLNNGELRTHTNGTIWAVDDLVGGYATTATVTPIAEGFHDPCGVVVVDGDIYISHRDDITRLRDADHDGSFETREVFVAPWTSDNYHHFSFGLIEHDGWLYGTLSTAIYFDNTLKADAVRGTVVSMNGPNPPHRGTCYRVNLATRRVEFLAGGFRTPNGVCVTPDGDVFVADNQGAWLPSSKLIHVKPDRFYGHYNGQQTSDRYPGGGHPSLFADQPVSPPAVWLPQNEVCNSPTTPLAITEGPFAGQLYLAELTMGGLRRVFLEEVNGEMQGAVFHCSQGFESGLNRLIQGPDGCLYVGGIGADGNWNWRNTRSGLQRLRPTGQTAFEYHSVSATGDGFAVRFTRPVDPAWLANPANYTLSQWSYAPTAEYGGPKVDEVRLHAVRALPDDDGRGVRLIVPGRRAGAVVRLRADPVSTTGEPMWATEAWYTLNAIPETPPHHPMGSARPGGVLIGFEALADGWAVSPSVRADGRTLVATKDSGDPVLWNGPEGAGTDLVSTFAHGDCHLTLEFMVPQGSNSGVYFQGRYELQILDSFGTAVPRFDDCGGVYQRWDESRGRGLEGFGGVAPSTNAARPAGEWQSLEVVFRAARFDPSGAKVANARFERVVLNNVEIHWDVELTGPTRGGWAEDSGVGPLRLQGDHGPVAYRGIQVWNQDE
jgi:glucose/arabinose dehydrogenase